MKHYFLFAAALLALASCSSDDILGGGQNSENATSAIQFGSETGKITRAVDNKSGGDAAGLLDNNFVVVGYKGNATDAANTGLVFDHYNVNYKDGSANTTESNTKNWEYVNQDQKVRGTNPEKKLAGDAVTAQTIKYWDNSVKSYDFLAFSMGKGKTTDGNKTYATPTAVKSDKLKDDAYTLTGDANTLGECYISDITTVEKVSKGYVNNAVTMNFRHATSKVRIALYETVPGYVISDVKFHDAAWTNGVQYTEGKTEGTLFGTFNKKGTMTVYFPTTGTAQKSNSDYNKAHVSFKADTEDGTEKTISFGTVNYGNAKEDAISEGATYLSQTAANPSYCGDKANNQTYYQTVLPAENASQPASIRIDYKLTATDGSGEVINVKNATATVPASYTAWKHGYAYTYIFKISQNTNGTTGTPGTDDQGLTAISFDAVVLDDEMTGKQETITTVSTPSITTYGYNSTTGKVTTNQNEYEVGTEIYATAFVPATKTGKATTAAPKNLYTVTIDEGAAQSINEATVANALKNGVKTPEGEPTSWTVSDANGKKLTVTTATGETVNEVPTEDGHKLTVNALKWTPDAAAIYAVEYEYTDANSETQKAYKIVKVVAPTPATPGENEDE